MSGRVLVGYAVCGDLEDGLHWEMPGISDATTPNKSARMVFANRCGARLVAIYRTPADAHYNRGFADGVDVAAKAICAKYELTGGRAFAAGVTETIEKLKVASRWACSK